MTDIDGQPWAPQPMKITITDKGETLEVADAQRWVDERKRLLRQARDIVAVYDGNPAPLYKHHATLIDITKRLAAIKVIFEEFKRQRARHADANIVALVNFYRDPQTMEGVDD